MSINFNYNYSNFTSNRANETGEANRAGRVGQVAHNGIITPGEQIRFTNMVNRILTENGAPTLDSIKIKTPEEVEEGLKSFGMKLNSALGSFRGKPILFDIYALMDLMQEMAQKMRDSLRELRNLENQTIQANIRGQAAIQRSAAINSMIAGAVLCGIQATVTVVTTVKAVNQMSKQMEMMKLGGVNVMSEQAKLADTVGNQQATNAKIESLQTKYPEMTKQTTGIIDSAEPGICAEQEGKLAAAEEKLTKFGRISKLEGLESKYLGEGSKPLESQLKVKETLLEGLKGDSEKVLAEEKANPGSHTKGEVLCAEATLKSEKVAALQSEIADLKELKELKSLREQVGLKPDEKLTCEHGKELFAAAGREKQDATLALGRAKAEYVLTQNENTVQTAANEYKAARAEANDQIAKNGKLTPEMRQKLETAEAKFVMTRAYQVQVANKLIESGVVPYNETINSVKLSASNLLSDAQDKAITKSDQILFGRLQTKLTAISGINQALGQFGQTLVSGIKELTSAAATELAAAQKMQEDQLDQIKDLFQQELSVIQKVFQLFEAVTQKESSTIENIIRA